MINHIGTREIITDCLILRRFILEDAKEMFETWGSDPEISKYMRWNPMTEVSQAEELLEKWVSDYNSPQRYHWAICRKDGRLMGSIGVFPADEYDGRYETGYCIGREFWNNGYTAEALSAVMDYMFFRVGINRFEAYHSVNNPASGRVMAKAGMIYEGRAKEKYLGHGGYQDSDLYGLTRRERLESYSGIAVLDKRQLEEAAEVIRESFKTVAGQLDLTAENCPRHTSFIKSERLFTENDSGVLQYGYFKNGRLGGYVSLKNVEPGVFELNHLSVLPELRHNGIGKGLIDFCKNEVMLRGGSRIDLSYIEEHNILKQWYLDNGFEFLYTKKYDHLPFTSAYMTWEVK